MSDLLSSLYVLEHATVERKLQPRELCSGSLFTFKSVHIVKHSLESINGTHFAKAKLLVTLYFPENKV